MKRPAVIHQEVAAGSIDIIDRSTEAGECRGERFHDTAGTRTHRVSSQLGAAVVVVDVGIDGIELHETVARARAGNTRPYDGPGGGIENHPARAAAMVPVGSISIPIAVVRVNVAEALVGEVVRQTANRRAEDRIDVRLAGQGKSGLTRQPRSRRGIRKRPGRRRRVRRAVGETLGGDARDDEGVGDDRQYHRHRERGHPRLYAWRAACRHVLAPCTPDPREGASAMPRERCDWTSRFIDVFSGCGVTRRVRHRDRCCLIAVSLSERGCARKIEGQDTQCR